MKPVPAIHMKKLPANLFFDAQDATALTLQSPASSVFIDFDSRQPMVVEQGVSVEDATYLMRTTHARLKLVVDSVNRFCGLISLRDISSIKVLATASAMGVARADLNVRDIMTPAYRLQGINRRVLEKSTIADLVEALEVEGQRYLMVLDDEGALGGVLEADEIALRTGHDLDIQPLAGDFNEVFSALRVHA